MNMGLVWMISGAETCTEDFEQECVSADSDSSLDTSMILLNLSWLFEVNDFVFDGYLVTPVLFLFCLPSLCDQPITLDVVDE